MNFEELIRLAAEAYAQLERENAELRRECERARREEAMALDELAELKRGAA